MTAYRYAARSAVPVNQSRGEIESLLTRIGADSTAFMGDASAAAVAFRLRGRNYVIRLPYPEARNDRERDQGIRSLWRALGLLVKAKLIAVESGVTTVEAEFLSHAMLPTGQTLGEHIDDHPEQLVTSGALRLPGGDRDRSDSVTDSVTE